MRRVSSRNKMSNTHQLHVFSFEPNSQLQVPYMYFPPSYHFHTNRSLVIPQFSHSPFPDLVTVSGSFTPEQLVDFLWQLKALCVQKIVPLIFVIDWLKPLTQIPGTTWGDTVGLLHSLSSPAEVTATLSRVVTHTKEHHARKN